MTDKKDKIDQLRVKLESLLRNHEFLFSEINNLKEEINQLDIVEGKQLPVKKELKGDKTVAGIDADIANVNIKVKDTKRKEEPAVITGTTSKRKRKPKIKKDLEKFIGENLVNKIGIAITVIGVSIGVKYAIDHELISPLTRILLGYFVGFGLLGFAFRLKKKYVNFSAVLLSGSMAIMYFISYVAFSYYHLFSQSIAFVFMVIITVFTVLAALKYNKQVIAHIGLVGAYAVPFLLSPEPGKVLILFSYMAIINIGILVIAFKKYWKPLHYSSFLLTWAIFFYWFLSSYDSGGHFRLALFFISLFFVIFYTMFMANKLIQKEKFDIADIILLLLNSFIFYGLGYVILSDHETGQHFLGMFTLCNAVIHFVASVMIYRKNLADKNLFYLVAGLVLVFTTIAIPVQLNGNWVTLLWITEAVLLFWIGRTKKISFYELLSYPLILLAFFSLLQDWSSIYTISNRSGSALRLTPFLSINFLSSILFIGAMSYIIYLNRNKDYPATIQRNGSFLQLISWIIPTIFLFAIYNTFRMEIAIYFGQLYSNSLITTDPLKSYWNEDLSKFETVWTFNYTAFFLAILSFLNINKLKDRQFGFINLGLNTLFITFFLTEGLYVLSELRESYLDYSPSSRYEVGVYHIYIRYISYAFVALLLAMSYKYIHKDFIQRNFKVAFDAILYISVGWILSSELIHWMDMAESTQSYKLGLSILWGVYSLLLVALGIWKGKKYLRIGAMALFGITLIKLFVYDIVHLDTISKTVVFVSLGILLLIISFLYNKYTHIISDKEQIKT